MLIRRVVVAALILVVTAMSVGAQSPEELRGTPKRARYIFPVQPRAGVVRAVPSNDNLANATVVGTALPYVDTVADFDLATHEVGEGSGTCGSEDTASIWYSYTPDVDAVISVDTYGSTFDTVIDVFTGSSVSCNDNFDVVDHAGYTSMVVSQNVSAGTTAMIRVAVSAGFALAPGDSATVRIRETPAPGAFNVNNTIDQVDMNIGDGVCLVAGGGCTLRAAINEANASQPYSTIMLPAGIYTSTIAAPPDPDSWTGGQLFENASINGDFDIVAKVTIIGNGPQSTIIDGGQLENVFEFHANATVILNGVQVRNGFRYGAGGGLRLNDAASVDATNVWVTQNTARFGGGITVEGGSLTMTNSAITNNVATGVIQIDPPNPTKYFAGNGGGLEVRDRFEKPVSINLRNVTISGNTAMTPDMSLDYCRAPNEDPELLDEDGNPRSHAGKGGGVYFGFAQKSISVTFNHVTMANNTAYCGGGIFTSAGVTINTRNTLIGDNTATANPDCVGFLGSNGSNLIENIAGCTTANGDINKDARLNPLFLNGPGSTPTHLPQDNSPARNNGNVATCTSVSTDQRGISRTDASTCDIGSLEVITGITPGPFDLLSPDNNALYASSDAMPMLSWTKSPSAYTYKVAFTTTLGVLAYSTLLQASQVCDTLVINECQYAFDGVLPDGFYKYTVEASVDNTVTKPLVASHLVQIDSVVGLPNLLANGGFESKGRNGQAAKWTAKGVSGDKRVCNTSTATYSHNGSCAYRFKGTKREKSSVQQKLNLNGLTLSKGKRFRFSFYSKAGSALRATVIMKVVYKKASITPNKRKLVLPAGDSIWTPISGEVTLKDRRVSKVVLTFTNTSKKGNWYIDDVRAIYVDGTILRNDTMDTRDGQNGGLLPPPAAPDGFRGNN